jgi:pyridoxal phosphate enzyme (YggS family)
MEDISKNLETVHGRIEKAAQSCGRDPGEIILCAVSKTRSPEEVNTAIDAGVTDIGENKVQELLSKYDALLKDNLTIHFIGKLQTNKVKYIIDKVELIHSVNTLKLIDEIEKQSKKCDKKTHILLEVNIADEDSKQGFDYHDVRIAMDKILECEHIIVDGLMMMAPHIEAKDTRIYFRKTKELLEELKEEYPSHSLNELSMGMSEDYHIALEEGATMVRIGRALFK